MKKINLFKAYIENFYVWDKALLFNFFFYILIIEK